MRRLSGLEPVRMYTTDQQPSWYEVLQALAAYVAGNTGDEDATITISLTCALDENTEWTYDGVIFDQRGMA